MHRVFIAGLLLAASSAHAITAGQTDTFEDGLPAGWTEGGPSPNQPDVVLGGGPAGGADSWLRNFASGSFGPGGAQVMFNFDQWTGDYTSAGVTSITADMANFGSTELAMRLAFEGAGGTRVSSSDAVLLPADGQWYSVTFGLQPGQMAIVSGSDTPQDVLAAVTSMRILAAAGGPEWIGDFVESTLGVDNLSAVAAVPLPASAWLLVGGLGVLSRFRKAAAGTVRT